MREKTDLGYVKIGLSFFLSFIVWQMKKKWIKDESNVSIYQEIMTKRELLKRKKKGNERETKRKIVGKGMDGGMYE